MKRLCYILLLVIVASSCKGRYSESGYGVIVGKNASTDGRVYLAHNSYCDGEQMLNIYNMPVTDSSLNYLWFEFPGLSFSDMYLNGSGVGIAVVPSNKKYKNTELRKFYSIVDEIAGFACSAVDGAGMMGSDYLKSGCSIEAVVMFADCNEGWLCSVFEDGSCKLQLVPDDASVYVFNNIISGKPEIKRTSEKHHRTDLCKSFIEMKPEKGIRLLSNVFCFDSEYNPMKGSCVYAGFPNTSYGQQSMWTPGTSSPDCCHRYKTAQEARKKHYSIFGKLAACCNDHFYMRYLHPEKNIDVVKHDFVVFVPTGVSDIYNDHFHVIDDPARGLLYAFWTQGTYEGANDMHISFSRSSDNGKTWSKPIILAGSPSLDHQSPRASYQQPMLSKSGRLYCLWIQETTSGKFLCGPMFGRYSDDGGLTWSEAEESPLSLRADTDSKDESIPPVWCNWQRPLRLGENGKFLTGSSRHGKAPYDSAQSCKVEFWQYENIDDDPQIKDIRISIFSNGRNSMSADCIETEHNFIASDGLAVEEASIVGLPDGRLFALMRSSAGHPVWSQSRDEGKTWDRPRILRMSDGRPVLHPRSPCPIYDVMGPEARSGRYVAFVHNTFDFDGMSSYQLRGPLYRIDGVFDPDSEQPIRFSLSDIFIPRESFNSLYSSYTPCDGGGILWFNDQKYYLFGRIIK